MKDRQHIEAILKVNGLVASSPDDEIKAVLISARFNADEAEAALLILRDDITNAETHVDGLHKVFRTDTKLKPAEISRLLGIDIRVLDEVPVSVCSRRFTLLQLVLLSLTSAVLAIVCLLLYMYAEGIGWFHPSAEPVVNLTAFFHE